MSDFEVTIRVGDVPYTFRRLKEQDFWEIDRRMAKVVSEQAKQQNPNLFSVAATVARMRVTLEVGETSDPKHDWSEEPTDVIAGVYEEYQAWLDSFRAVIRGPDKEDGKAKG